MCRGNAQGAIDGAAAASGCRPTHGNNRPRRGILPYLRGCSPRSETVEHPARRQARSPLGNRLPQDFRFRHRPPRRRAGHDRDRREWPQGDSVLHGPRTSGRASRHDRSRCRYSCPGRAPVPLADRPSPVSRSSSAETLDQVRNQDPVPPRRLNGRIPRDLETICLTCLEKAPNRRYPTADALAGDLRLWLEGRPIVARPVSPMGLAWRLCRRHPAVAGLLFTLAMTLATGVVGLFVLLNQAAAERARLAEARRNAEAYEQFSASVADQLGEFLRKTIRYRPSTSADQVAEALLKLRSSINNLKGRGIVPSSTLGVLELEIGWALMYSSKAEEARDLLNQATADLKQSLAKTPGDKETRSCLGSALIFSGCLADERGSTRSRPDLLRASSRHPDGFRDEKM